jgi:hypothetical protein
MGLHERDRINTIVIDLDQGLVTVEAHRETVNADGGVVHRRRLTFADGVPSLADDRKLVELVGDFCREHIVPRLTDLSGAEFADPVKAQDERIAARRPKARPLPDEQPDDALDDE